MTAFIRESGAALANTLWWGQSRRSARRFDAALRSPAEAQWHWLSHALAGNATCEYGQRHDFGGVRQYADFVRRVPIVTYHDIAPEIDRMRDGARGVLTTVPVTHLAPTSGSTGARKLVPFTRDLQRHFGTAVNIWWADLVRQRPALLGGPGYWSVSPLEAPEVTPPPGAVRVGFADDAEYLGAAMAWLVRQALAVPASVRHAAHGEAFWGLTLTALLRRRALRMLSVWHPSFLQLLCEQAVRLWPQLLEAVASGEAPGWVEALPPAARRAWRAAPAPMRARELRQLGAHAWHAWWPRLAVVSAWGDQAALPGFARLRDTLARAAPHVLVQPKGLLATEAVVTVPYGGTYPLAVTSHAFEFLDRSGNTRTAADLERGAHYEVIVTNGGGLWRYRLGDMVECTGHLAATPTLRFLGRAGRGCDLRGEKLTEVFVAEVLRGLWADEARPYAVLQAYDDGDHAGYELRTTAAASEADAVQTRCEDALQANPHYAIARTLGQLQPVRVVRVAADEEARTLATHQGRLGDAKPQVLRGPAGAPREPEASHR